ALQEYSIEVTTYDPWANPAEVMHEYGLTCQSELVSDPSNSKSAKQSHPVTQSPSHQFDAIVLTVAHKEFLDLDLKQYLKEGGVIYDVKGVLLVSDKSL